MICAATLEHDYKEKFGKSTLQLVLSEDLALVIDALADLTENEENSKIMNFRIQCADGSIKWVNAVIARSGSEEQGFPVVNLVMSDITSLKIAETKAMLEEQKYLIISDISRNFLTNMILQPIRSPLPRSSTISLKVNL